MSPCWDRAPSQGRDHGTNRVQVPEIAMKLVALSILRRSPYKYACPAWRKWTMDWESYNQLGTSVGVIWWIDIILANQSRLNEGNTPSKIEAIVMPSFHWFSILQLHRPSVIDSTGSQLTVATRTRRYTPTHARTFTQAITHTGMKSRALTQTHTHTQARARTHAPPPPPHTHTHPI